MQNPFVRKKITPKLEPGYGGDESQAKLYARRGRPQAGPRGGFHQEKYDPNTQRMKSPFTFKVLLIFCFLCPVRQHHNSSQPTAVLE